MSDTQEKSIDDRSRIRQRLIASYAMPYGALRRKALLAWLADYGALPVNNKHQANLRDPDLRHMLKRGKVLRRREAGSAFRCGKHQTLLYISPAGRKSLQPSS